MQIILGIIFVVILLALLSQSGTLTTRAKTIIFTVVMMVIASSILYEFMFSKASEKNRDLINAFKQNKTLICKDAKITQEDYNLESGTLSFMAKDGKKEIVGSIYAVEDCKIYE